MILICVILEFVSVLGLIYSIIEGENKIGLAILSVFGCAHLFVGIIYTVNNSPETHEYKASEYTFEYKITTIGEQSDTTYVLAKIKED